MKKSSRKGVTLLELILVIAIIAILFAVIFVSLDPGRRLNEANNSARRIAAASVADAIAKQRLDNAGDYYTTVDAHVDSLATAGGGGALSALGSARFYTTTDLDADGIPDDVESECSGLSFASAFNCAGMTATSDDDADGAIDWYEVMIMGAAANHARFGVYSYDPSDNTIPGSTLQFTNSDGGDSVMDLYELMSCDAFGLTLTVGPPADFCADYDNHITDSSDEDSDGTVDASEITLGTYLTIDEGTLGASALVLTVGQYYYAMIGTDTSTCSKSTTLADVCDNTVGTDTCIDLSGIGANYLSEVPVDPDAGNTSRDATQTGYYFGIGSENELVVGSCDAAGEDAGGAGTAETIQIFR